MRRFLTSIFTSALLVVSVAVSQTSTVKSTAADNPLNGTWVANLSKTQPHPKFLFKSFTVRFEVSDETVVLTFDGVNMAGEQQKTSTLKLQPDGKEHQMGPGLVMITKWAGTRILEISSMKDGKVMGQMTFEVSSDGKTLTQTWKRPEGNGSQVEHSIVFDRQ